MARKKSTGKKRKLTYKQVKAINRKKLRAKAKRRLKYINRKRRQVKCINVSNEKEVFTKTVNRPKLNKKYRMKLSKAFKSGYSPFETQTASTIQLPTFTATLYNRCKWVYKGSGSLNMVRRAFLRYPQSWYGVGDNYTNSDNRGAYAMSETQSICFYKITQKYEIINNGNYDVNLVMYDIVYKEDCHKNECTDAYYEHNNQVDSTTGDVIKYYNSIRIQSNGQNSVTNQGDPISLIHNGLVQLNAHPSNVSTETSNVVADPDAKQIYTISVNPTDSYLFNIFCKIVRKRVVRLQPGASMTHTFVHKPKKLISRGYMGMKYSLYFRDAFTDNEDTNIGLKDLTCGTLFKTWGQLVNKGTGGVDTSTGTLPACISIKETSNIKYYCMDPKYTYKFYEQVLWNPDNETEANAAEIINTERIHQPRRANIDPNDDGMDE